MLSFIGLCVLLWLGHLLRVKVKLFQKLYLPGCVIAGVLGLIIIQVCKYAGAGEYIADWYFGWNKLPGFLINIVFACLFLGVSLPKVSVIWKRAGSQLAYGQIVAWGQYAVAIGAWFVLLKVIWPELPAVVAGILPVGFEGGHGTAAAMAEVFENNGFSAGKDLALTSATFGILGAVIFGMALVNWATRKGYTVRKADPASIEEDDSIGIIPVDRRPIAGRLTVNSDAIESVTLHLAIVGIAILIGFVIQRALVGIEIFFDFKVKILSGFPLFPLCLIGGFVVQFFEQRYDKGKVIDVGLMKRIQNTSLDFLVVAAIATINLAVVSKMLLPLLVLVALGILWNVFCVVVVARRVLPDAWFERSIAEMGQSMGVTATGLLLLRVVDPEYETPAVDAFAYKQLLHEPIMGGGLWTAAAIPLIFTIGALPVLGISVGAMVIWSVVLLLLKIKN